MRKKLYIAFILATTLVACSHYDEIQSNPKESGGKEDESHNMGQNCMKCHNDNNNEASSEGWWNVAGTAYDSNKDLAKSRGYVEL